MNKNVDLSKHVAEDVTPTWEAILPLLLQSANSDNYDSKKSARDELKRMANLADRYVVLMKEQEPKPEEDLEADGWICTDPDCNQYRKDLADNKFLFREDRIDDIELETTEVFELEIELGDYSLEHILSACGSFGYSAKQVVNWMNTGQELALIAECIFELE